MFTKRRNKTAATTVVAAFVASIAAVMLSAAGAAAQDAPTIAVTAVDPAAGTIELTNYGDAEVDPNGIILCNFPAYGGIEGAPTIPPGESISIDSAANGVALDPAGGEMGLYLTPAYEDPTQIISYVEWGEPGHQRSSVAIAAGVWAEGVADSSDGTLVAASDNPSSPADWAPQATTTDAGEGDGESEAAAGSQDDELAQTGAETGLLVIAGLALALGGLGLWRTSRHTGRVTRA